LEPELCASQHYLYRVFGTALSPAVVGVRTRRKRLFAVQTAFGQYRSKTEWVCNVKVALVVTHEGVITAFFLATAICDERPPEMPS
jgi:hypothetical protein